MTDQIEELREKVLAVLRRNDVKRAAFFGSIVRGEMTEESDVDILVEFAGRMSPTDLLVWRNAGFRAAIEQEAAAPPPRRPDARASRLLTANLPHSEMGSRTQITE